MEVLSQSKNTKQKIQNFEYGFRPIYCFSRFFGQWPFSIVHHENGTIQKARISRLDGVWFWISVCLQLTAIFCSYLESDDVSDRHATTFTFCVIYFLYRLKSLIIGIFGIILDMLNRHKLANILGQFIIHDNEVSKQNHH